MLDDLQRDLPPDVKVERRVFRQSDFIQAAVGNVAEAIWDGTIWVFVVLSCSCGTSAPASSPSRPSRSRSSSPPWLFYWLGVTINTMTLGGIAVAVGELVDDAIVDVENI